MKLTKKDISKSSLKTKVKKDISIKAQNNKENLPPRTCDTKDDSCSCNLENMVYLSDGVYIHEDDAWF